MPPVKKSLSDIKILIAEDDPGICEMLVFFLGESEGAQVRHTGNGKDALELGRRECFDLILLDLTLPQLDGESVMRELRTTGIAAPIIALSGRPLKEKAAGFNAYIGKPFDLSSLVSVLESCLTNPRTAWRAASN